MAAVIVEAGKSKIYKTEFPLLWETSVFALKAFNGVDQAPYIIEGSLLKVK